MLENAGGDVVDTLMVTVDDEGFEKVARRYHAVDLSHFRASRAGLTQREKKRVFARATSVQNVFDVLADHDDNDDDDRRRLVATKSTREVSRAPTP